MKKILTIIGVAALLATINVRAGVTEVIGDFFNKQYTELTW